MRDGGGGGDKNRDGGPGVGCGSGKEQFFRGEERGRGASLQVNSRLYAEGRDGLTGDEGGFSTNNCMATISSSSEQSWSPGKSSRWSSSAGSGTRSEWLFVSTFMSLELTADIEGKDIVDGPGLEFGMLLSFDPGLR